MWLGSDGLPDDPAEDEVAVRAHVQTETIAPPGGVMPTAPAALRTAPAAAAPTPWRVPAPGRDVRAVA
jgi:hypothetical protein